MRIPFPLLANSFLLSPLFPTTLLLPDILYPSLSPFSPTSKVSSSLPPPPTPLSALLPSSRHGYTTVQYIELYVGKGAETNTELEEYRVEGGGKGEEKRGWKKPYLQLPPSSPLLPFHFSADGAAANDGWKEKEEGRGRNSILGGGGGGGGGRGGVRFLPPVYSSWAIACQRKRGKEGRGEVSCPPPLSNGRGVARGSPLRLPTCCCRTTAQGRRRGTGATSPPNLHRNRKRGAAATPFSSLYPVCTSSDRRTVVGVPKEREEERNGMGRGIRGKRRSRYFATLPPPPPPVWLAAHSRRLF